MIRLSEEIEELRKQYPQLQFHKETTPYWVLIPDFTLPEGMYNRKSIDVHFLIPQGYPQSGPDNFFVNTNLRLSNGSMPSNFKIQPNASHGIPRASGEWSWFSWHPKKWIAKPEFRNGDNLITFVMSIIKCLNGAKET